ncbi:MAG: S8 family serine peptidase, partial [Hyphomicrobium sp.]
GFQQQASHLGMGSEPLGEEPQVPLGEEPWPFVAGLTRLVRIIPVLGQPVSDLIRHPLGLTVSDSGDSLKPDPGSAGEATAASSDKVTGERAHTVGLLPGSERQGGAPASSTPCPHETCFGPSLINWNPELSACTKDVRIGVIDTSFDLAHPAFKRLRVVRKEFIEGATPSDEDWHGTAVLSLLAGDPQSGTPGLVPDATFLLATAFRSDAQGNATTDTVRLLDALNWLDELDVDIVNLSFAGPSDSAIARTIERMSLKGIIFVAAAGNMGPAAPPSYPGAYPHVIAVTAVNRAGENYRAASRGDYIDLAAPGVDILTALPNGKQGLRTGTSFAVPFVTAILATRAASDIVDGTEDMLLERFSTRDLGQPGRDPIYGAGLVLAPETCMRADMMAKGPAAKNKKAADKAGSRKQKLKAGVAEFRW